MCVYLLRSNGPVRVADVVTLHGNYVGAPLLFATDLPVLNNCFMIAVVASFQDGAQKG